MSSDLWTLDTKDFVQGLASAVIGAIVGVLLEVLNTGGLQFNMELLNMVGNSAGIAALTYITKRFSSNNKGEIFTPNKEVQ